MKSFLALFSLSICLLGFAQTASAVMGNAPGVVYYGQKGADIWVRDNTEIFVVVKVPRRVAIFTPGAACRKTREWAEYTASTLGKDPKNCVQVSECSGGDGKFQFGNLPVYEAAFECK